MSDMTQLRIVAICFVTSFLNGYYSLHAIFYKYSYSARNSYTFYPKINCANKAALSEYNKTRHASRQKKPTKTNPLAFHYIIGHYSHSIVEGGLDEMS